MANVIVRQFLQTSPQIDLKKKKKEEEKIYLPILRVDKSESLIMLSVSFK